MFKVSLIAITLFFASNVMATQMPSVKSLLERSKQPNNLHSASVALVRCAAMLDLSQIIAGKNVNNSTKVDPTTLLKGAVNIRLKLNNVSGSSPEALNSQSRHTKAIMTELKSYFSQYQQWFKAARNESQNSDYFDDPILKEEFVICHEVYDSFMNGLKQ